MYQDYGFVCRSFIRFPRNVVRLMKGIYKYRNSSYKTWLEMCNISARCSAYLDICQDPLFKLKSNRLCNPKCNVFALFMMRHYKIFVTVCLRDTFRRVGRGIEFDTCTNEVVVSFVKGMCHHGNGVTVAYMCARSE